jgi:hypothetical protein
MEWFWGKARRWVCASWRGDLGPFPKSRLAPLPYAIATIHSPCTAVMFQSAGRLGGKLGFQVSQRQTQ